jgi:hypothetical protein
MNILGLKEYLYTSSMRDVKGLRKSKSDIAQETVNKLLREETPIVHRDSYSCLMERHNERIHKTRLGHSHLSILFTHCLS